MGDFFHGWRRKFGLLTLVMALAFMAGWMRSFVEVESLWLPIGNNISLVSSSFYGSLLWHFEIAENGEIIPEWTSNHWHRVEPAATPTLKWCDFFLMLSDTTFNLDWEWGGFGVVSTSSPGTTPRKWFAVPYWSITLPMTLISLWLLLKKPRKSTQRKIIESISSEEK